MAAYMKTRLLLAFLSSIACCPVLFSQQLAATIFGETGSNLPHKMWQMPDGNIALVSGFSVNWLPKMNLYHLSPEGAVLTQYQLPDPTLSVFIEPSADGSTFRYGRIGTAGYMIQRMSLTGQTLDSITYNPADPWWDDYFFAIQQAPGGDVVLAYEDQEPPQGVRVVRLGQQGNVVFNKFVGSFDPDFYSNALTVLPNGRTIVVVLDYSQGYRVICYGPTGNLLWTKGVPQIPSFPEEFGLVPTGGGEVAIWGRDGFIGNEVVDGYAAVYKPDGNFVYNRTFENELPGFKPYAAFADGDHLIVAGNYGQVGEYGLGVIKLAADGQTVFVKKFNLLSGTENLKAVMDKNGNYLFSGFRWLPIPPGYQSDKGYVLCLQPDGTLNWFAPVDDYNVRRMSSFCHLDNGDVFLAGQTNQPAPPANNYPNLLLHVAGIGPLYSQLVEGNIVTDSIENCEPDTGEPRLDGWIVKAETPGGNRYAVSDAAGNYSVRLNTNSANLSIPMPNDLWQSCQAVYPLSFSGSDTASLDIPVRQVAQCPFLSLDAAAPVLRRCFDNKYYFNWCNTGTMTAENTVLTISLDDYNDYVSASLPLAAQNGQELSFQLGDIAPGQCGELKLTVNTSCDAELGQMHCLEANITAGESCPGHPGHTASDRDCQENTGAFDPNDKRAFVRDTLLEGDILPNTGIEYQIRFQNTGTDTAFNIVIVDTIDNTLDVSTLRPGIASHPYTFQLHGDRVAKFVFNNIQLPDSNVNEAASNGFVNFSIGQKPDLPLLTEIRNRADIYFDYNAPVATNEHKLVVSGSSAAPVLPDASASVIIYPNPAIDGYLWLENRRPGSILQSVFVFDATGRPVLTVHPRRNKIRLELPAEKGVYFAKIRFDNGHWDALRIVR